MSGPGQNARMSRQANAGTVLSAVPRALLSPGESAEGAVAPVWCATPGAQSGGRWTINGWSAGRPLAMNMRCTASAWPASAARPYTVSVGRPSNPPSANCRAACCTALSAAHSAAEAVTAQRGVSRLGMVGRQRVPARCWTCGWGLVWAVASERRQTQQVAHV